MNSIQIKFSSNGATGQAHLSRTAAPAPDDPGNKVLRQAVLENLVSFPSQVPSFGKQIRPALQQYIVLLYFVRGWPTDQIANRYGLGQARIVQILTTWRIRAINAGYIQPVEPAHPLFLQPPLEQSTQVSETRVRTPSVAKVVNMTRRPIPAALQVDESSSSITKSTQLRGLTLVEKLHAVVGVLDNQLRFCSESSRGNLDSCEQLLARARTLCANLEDQIETHDDGARKTAVISAAKELLRRFQGQGMEHSCATSNPVLGDGANGQQLIPRRT